MQGREKDIGLWSNACEVRVQRKIGRLQTTASVRPERNKPRTRVAGR